MENHGHWIIKEDNIPPEAIGFIYRITNTTNNYKYIGKKLLKFKTTKQPLKGRTNKRRGTKNSNWETYTGSCDTLNKDILEIGKDKFKFEILHWCKSKLELSYMEVKYIIDANAIFSVEYYNQYLGCRLRNKK
jgi:hypothetical protein